MDIIERMNRVKKEPLTYIKRVLKHQDALHTNMIVLYYQESNMNGMMSFMKYNSTYTNTLLLSV